MGQFNLIVTIDFADSSIVKPKACKRPCQVYVDVWRRYMCTYVRTYMYVYSYYVILSWISIILIHIAVIGDWLLRRQAFYWVVFNLVWWWSRSYLLLVTFASQRLKTHGFRRKLLFKLRLGQSHRGSGMHGHAPSNMLPNACCRARQGFSLLILVLSCHPCLSLTPREIEISGCCRWTRLSTAWLQSWDHSGLNLSKIIGDCWSVWCFWLDSYFFCGHKLRTAWNSLWTLLNCLSNKVSRPNLTILTPCRTHTDMFLHDSNIKVSINLTEWRLGRWASNSHSYCLSWGSSGRLNVSSCLGKIPSGKTSQRMCAVTLLRLALVTIGSWIWFGIVGIEILVLKYPVILWLGYSLILSHATANAPQFRMDLWENGADGRVLECPSRKAWETTEKRVSRITGCLGAKLQLFY